MTVTLIVPCLLVALAAAEPSDDAAARKARVDRVSDTLLSKNEAWNEPGFRLQLGLASEDLTGSDAVSPNASGFGPTLHLGVRLSEDWSVLAGLRYSFLGGKMGGTRWTATTEAVYHIVWGLSASLGVGYGGMSGNRRNQFDVDYSVFFDDPAPIDISGQAPRASRDVPYNKCQGDGFVVMGRLQYLLTVGDMFATGPEVRLEHQWTPCTDDAMRAYLREDLQKLPVQWWAQRSLTYGWVVAWR